MGDQGYDDAYETPGWTAQNFAYPPSSEPTITTPAGLKAVELVGTFFDDRGRPMNGRFIVVPKVRRVRADGKTVSLMERKFTIRNGVLENAYLLSPDGTQVVYPPTWEYDTRLRLGPTTTKSKIVVPIADAVYDLFNVASEASPTVVDEFPITRNYTFTPGSTFRKSFAWARANSDLSTWTAKLQIRSTYGGTLLLELTETAGITLGAGGEIDILITAEQTEVLADGVYDLELYEPAGDTVRFLEGTLKAGTPQVTV